MTTADTIDRAADLLQARGKACGMYYDPETGAVCALGALALAYGIELAELDDDSDAFIHDSRLRPALRAIRDLGRRDSIPVWSDYNDLPTVVAGLRAVAASLRAAATRELETA